MHDVAPRAVIIADAIDAISCAINLMVSFFVIMLFGFFNGKIGESVGAFAPNA